VPSLDKLKERLLLVEETQLLELLEISAEDLVDRFEDRIILRKLYLTSQLEYLPEDATEKYVELNFD
jgi:hypothetical protein